MNWLISFVSCVLAKFVVCQICWFFIEMILLYVLFISVL